MIRPCGCRVKLGVWCWQCKHLHDKYFSLDKTIDKGIKGMAEIARDNGWIMRKKMLHNRGKV